MARDFLVIDREMNTLIISGEELVNILRKDSGYLERIRKHNTLKGLDADVRAYLKSTYGGR